MEARQAHSTKRQEHAYISLPKQLANVIDTIVSTVNYGGDKKYQDRKDFVIKSIQAQVEYETSREQSLKKTLSKFENEILVKRRGNRIHDATFRIK